MRFKNLTTFLAIAAVAVCLLRATQVFAISIDDFNGSQFTIANSSSPYDSNAGNFSETIGGARTVEVFHTGGPSNITAYTSGGVYSHSQNASTTGISILTWDGDTNVTSINHTGLGGIDLLEDGGTKFIFKAAFDYANNGPIEIILRVYENINRWSFKAITLNAASSDLTIEIPFTDLLKGDVAVAPANLNQVGAIQLYIIGSTAASDLELRSFRTDGECAAVYPGTGGKAYDACGVCGGDGESCKDCKGIHFGTAKVDRCGVCDGDGQSCLQCTTQDIRMTQFLLDGVAKEQERVIANAIKRLRKTKINRKTSIALAKIAVRANQLQVRNWIISWTIPSFPTTCANANFCATTSHANYLDEYRQHSSELRDMALEVAKMLRSRKLTHNSTVKAAQKWHQESLKLSYQVPLTTTVCT
ncbi:MAG TPA: hypothetical protein PKD37_07770 [Oligoflexia bacterium]|nr:hypothetical protein [Oligoflexia bacterium]HMP27860.1 hypothetical protein [Oligoflexia bacterium]